MKVIRFISIFLFLIGAREIQAAENHLALGAGPLVVAGHHYRGSDQSKIWVFPLPYFSYRSNRLEAEPSFIRGILFHNRWFSFKLSLVPGLNVESKKNRARAGMPSLDYSIEIGPMAIFHLWENESGSVAVNFEWPGRESFATDLSYVKPAGFITVPYFNLIYKPRENGWNFDSEFSISPMFADKKYHDRFYSVPVDFETPDRRAFRASGGYSGTQSAVVFNKSLENFSILSFVRWDYLKGAAFMPSPLVKRNHYFIGGLGVFWMFN